MRIEDKPGLAWLNGFVVDTATASLTLFNHSLHYGFSVFEGLRSYSTSTGVTIFRGPEHIARLFHSAQLLGIQVPWSSEKLLVACHEVLEANRLWDAYIRPIVYLGNGLAGLKDASVEINAAILAWPWAPPSGAREQGISLLVSTHRKPCPPSFPLQAKASGNYLLSKVAYQEARQLGFDDALLLDADGYVSEATAQNIFIVRSRELITPDNETCLNGITRNAVMDLGRKMGRTVRQLPLRPDDLCSAEEIFLTSTAAEVLPVTRLNNTVVGNGRPGPLTRSLHSAYSELVRGGEPAPNAVSETAKGA
jgi:branched-chain amino acid aminotransferase